MFHFLKLLRVLFVIFLLASIITYSLYEEKLNATPLQTRADDSYWLTVLLLPLDSRPPCTQFVQQLAHIAGIRLLMPPTEILDNYKTPANKEALRLWLSQTNKHADAAIISTDMLIHGSLVASRLSYGTVQDTQSTLELLTSLHQENPRLKMYVFNIIPRLIIGDSQKNSKYQKDMLQYSVLKDQFYTFENPQDLKKLTALEEKIPAEIIDHYMAMYEENAKLNVTLINMVEQAILSGLIIGQDDGQPFGIPTMNKQRLKHLLQQKPALADKVHITRGTDEVALTMLGHIITQLSNYQPRVFAMYSTSEGSQITMPFMPNTVDVTLKEKIRIAGAVQVANMNEADFIIYIHVGTEKGKSTHKTAVEQVKNLINQGYKVALVDLAENFQSSETLLPELINENVDIIKLIAYAGWNSTSNSIGTAITQGCVFTKSLASKDNMSELMPLYKANLEFLVARFLDDLYYQKEINPFINKQLQRLNIDPYNLEAHYNQTNYVIQKLMAAESYWLFRKSLYNRPISITTGQETQKIVMSDLNIETYLPWQRTFEIYLKTNIPLAIVNE